MAAASGAISLRNRQVGAVMRRTSILLLLGLQVLLPLATAAANDAEHQRGSRTTRSSDSSGSGGSFAGDAGVSTAGIDVTAPAQPLLPEAAEADWLVTVGGCSGVLIAPKFVLTSAGCTEQEESLEAGVVESVQLWLSKDNQSIEIPIAREHQAATMYYNPSSAVEGHPASGFVIVELSEEAPARPVVLESPAESIKEDTATRSKYYQRERVQLVGALQNRDTRQESGGRFAAEGRRDDHACPEDRACVVASVACSALLSPSVRGPVFLVAQRPRGDGGDQDARLLGVNLASASSSCRGDSRKPGSSVNLFLSIASFAELIDLYSMSHKWSSPGSSDAVVDADEDSGKQQPPSLVLLNELDSLGYVRVENETRTAFGAYVVLIAPRFALTRAQWLRESAVLNSSLNQTRLQVVFITETIPVKRLIFQREMQGQLVHHDDEVEDGDLVALELEIEAKTTPSRILGTSLQLDVVSAKTQIAVLDAASEYEEVAAMPILALLKDSALSACEATRPQSARELVCANAPLFAQHTPPAILKQGILVVNNCLVGFSASSTSMFLSAGSERYERYRFTRLSSERDARFLTNATQSTAVLQEEEEKDKPIVDEQDPGDVDADFPSFIATFSAGREHAEPILCQGMLVAPKCVLTTASCALENSISEIIFQLPDSGTIRVPYAPQMTIPHPKYNRSAILVEERFDIAIMQLDFAVSVTPATLSLGGRANQTSDELLGFQIQRKKGSVMEQKHPLHFSRVALNRSEKCSTRGLSQTTSSLSTNSQASLCFTPARDPGRQQGEDSQVSSPEVGDDNTPPSESGREQDQLIQASPPLPPLTSLDGSVIGKQLNSSRLSMVGFAVAQHLYDTSGADDGASEVYSITGVADFAVFINAYVAGASWESGGLTIDGPLQISKQYIVGLRVSKTGQNFCGGSLVAPSYVLTAAHCVTDGLANWVSVGSSSSSGASTETIPIIKESIVIHHKYGSPSQFSFDAAIFELKSPAYADPVKLDRSPDFASGEKATMYGYGVVGQPRSASSTSNANAKTLSSEIHAVGLSLLSQAQCKATLPDIDRSMLCAVGDNGGDACKGDSGGPLVVPESRGDQDVLVGFVSSGYDCGLKNVPGIYMRVSSLTEFIKDNTVGAAWSTVAVTKQPPQRTPTVSPVTPSLMPSTDPELRDLDDLTPSNSPTSADGSSSGDDSGVTPSTTTSQSSRNAPIRAVDLPNDLKPQVRDAVLQYLLGVSSDSDYFISSEFLELLASEANEIWFFSSGDLSNLLEILKRHNKQPLYARRDRFKRRKTGAEALREETSTTGRRNGGSDSTVCSTS